jgi:hypothetical protein
MLYCPQLSIDFSLYLVGLQVPHTLHLYNLHNVLKTGLGKYGRHTYTACTRTELDILYEPDNGKSGHVNRAGPPLHEMHK